MARIMSKKLEEIAMASAFSCYAGYYEHRFIEIYV